MIGSIRMNEGQLDAAELSFLAAVAADPASVAGYGSLGVLSLQRGERASARGYFEKVLEIDPGNQDVLPLLRQVGGGG